MKLFPILFVISILTFLSGCRSYKYESGRDTVAMLGDGRFQVSESMNNYALFESGSSLAFAEGVSHWKQDKSFAYVVGYTVDKMMLSKEETQNRRPKFLVIDLLSYKTKWYKTLSQIPVEHRSVFEDLMKEKQSSTN